MDMDMDMDLESEEEDQPPPKPRPSSSKRKPESFKSSGGGLGGSRNPYPLEGKYIDEDDRDQ